MDDFECRNFSEFKNIFGVILKSFTRWPTFTEVQDHITYQLFKSDDWRFLAIVDHEK